jgi:tetratricopeptide (TPR) repeat protein
MMIDINTLLERADLLLQQGRHKDAEEYIKQVLEQEPENDEALALLARSYINSGKSDEAIETINRAIVIEPNNSFYFYLLAFAYYRKDTNGVAISNLNKAIELNPYYAEYFGLLSLIHIEEKDFELALEKANEGLALNARNITCLNARATALNKLKRTEAAFETMQDALSEDPDNEHTHTTVGWNLLEKGRHKDATRHFMEALRIDPNYVNAKAGLKEALKSKVLPYKLMLKYGFWINNQGRGLQKAMPFIIYAVFRVLLAIFDNMKGGGNLTLVLVSVYILFVVTSWTINSIANFFLLFDKVGKHALTISERNAALTAVPSLLLGVLLICIASFTNIASGTSYQELLLPGMVLLSLALPLGQIQYPVRIKGSSRRQLCTLALTAFGILCLLIFIIAPSLMLQPLIVYGIAFVIYTWVVGSL